VAGDFLDKETKFQPLLPVDGTQVIVRIETKAIRLAQP